ncbi:MAG: RdgB/HAM1 family non-canonical purine NTP pyrophosphatase [Planctomycetaceae bacterium]|nr:RdgB/HAM1 family non-canonical purine NTP pyrophosphatase [Planctomycetaceae bacterium]
MTAMLVIGTANRKKGLELAGLLLPVGAELRTLADFNVDFEVAEDGESFAANARLKAAGYAKHLKQWVLADDSGLAVDALGGAPGVLSARYSGPDATDHSNNQLLLERLADVPLERRTAQFVCRIAVSDPAGEIVAESDGACHGRILFEPRGEAGFGYDPLFEIVEYHRTFAELGVPVKALLSHRARAVLHVIPQLMELADSGKI